jgi:hypothetical protein
MAGIASKGKPADRLDAIRREAVPEGSSTECSAAEFRRISAPPAAMVPELSLFPPAERPLTASGAWATCGSGIGA